MARFAIACLLSLILAPLLSRDASCDTWTTARLGYTTGYDYPSSNGDKIIGGPNPGAFTASLAVVPESPKRWRPGLVASYWVFHVKNPSDIEGPDIVRTSHLAIIGPVVRFTLGSLQSPTGVYLEGGPGLVWMGIDIRENAPTGFRNWESRWVAALRVAGAISVMALGSGGFEVGLEYLHTQDINVPDGSPLYDMDGVKEWGAFVGFAW